MGIDTKKVSVAAVIPAKMTSQRFPEKNLASLCGNPLLYYSIRVARLCEMIDSVYVSSEDDRVLQLAEQHQAGIIRRDPELSEAHVTNEMVLSAALNEIEAQEGRVPELLVLLQPTHPLRQPSDVDQAIHKMAENSDSDCLFSLVHTDELRGEIKEGQFIPEYPVPRNKSQEKTMYRNTGSFYIFRVANTLRGRSFFGDKIIPHVLDRPEFEVDIDYPSDLRLASSLLKSHAEEFPHFEISK